MHRFASGLFVAVLGGAIALGQTAEFEVAAVRPNVTGSNSSSINTPPSGLVTATNVTVRMLILSAYRLHRLRLVGGPEWIDRERFDIVARRPSGTSSDDLPPMWQSLLQNRFKLRVRYETREQPVYRMVVARADRRLGPQIRASAADCAAFDAARRTGAQPPPAAGGGLPCNVRASILNDGQAIISIAGRDLAQLANSLATVGPQDRVVVDRTGLAGGYDLDLRWRVEPVPGRSTTDPLEPLSLFTAIQEQLGLRLEPGREPVEVLVIEGVERPAAD